MKYRKIIFLWILILVFFSVYENQKLVLNNLINDAQTIEIPLDFEVNDLYRSNDVSYFYIYESPLNMKIVFGNEKFYENLEISNPQKNEYYGNRYLEGYDQIGKSPILDFSNNLLFFNIENLNGQHLSDNFIYFSNNDSNVMYDIQKNAISNGFLTGSNSPMILSNSYILFKKIVNIFFLILIILFIFIEIDKYSKYVAVCKTLGYSLFEILKPIALKQIISSLTYFILLIIPLIMILYFGNSAVFYFIKIFTNITVIYIFTILIYNIAFFLTFNKLKIIAILKGKSNVTLIDFISNITNIMSKFIIIILLTFMLIPSFQIIDLAEQYNKYIKEIDDYIWYQDQDLSSDNELIQTYNKLQEYSVMLIARTTKYIDFSEYIDDNQFMAVNYNYMEQIGEADGLTKGENYILIPTEMKKNTVEIIDDVEGFMLKNDYEVQYYDNKFFYTYNPIFDYRSNGFIRYPVIIVVDNWDDAENISYLANNLYYKDENISDNSDYTKYLNDNFNEKSKTVFRSSILTLVLCLLFALLIVLSTYYMLLSYISLNGMEISLKKILGYSNFNIYKSFYLVDSICYIFGFIYFTIVSIIFIIPIWFILIYILIIIILNEIMRRKMIKLVEKNSIINILKGESI